MPKPCLSRRVMKTAPRPEDAVRADRVVVAPASQSGKPNDQTGGIPSYLFVIMVRGEGSFGCLTKNLLPLPASSLRSVAAPARGLCRLGHQ